jgi:Fic family protein
MAKFPFSLPKLPPVLDYTKLVSDIAEAHAALGKLDALLSQLENPRLISRSLVTREAVLSSQIEGTEATLGEVLEQEAHGIENEETPKERDYREIINYRNALEYGVEALADHPLAENLIKELHKILLNSVRGKNRGPGEFRKKLVYIGKPGASIDEATYIPPLPQEISELFGNLEQYIHSSTEPDILVQIGIIHYQFEAIHPFEDGNGRIGRLLISLMLYQKKLLSYPFIYLSEFFEEHRRDYYDLLRGISEQGDWESWLKFFLRGICIQAKKAQEISQKILHLHASLNTEVTALNSKYAHRFLDSLFVNPYFSSRTIRTITKIHNTQTLYILIDKFKRAGIIVDMTPHKQRNKIYRFEALFRLLEQ